MLGVGDSRNATEVIGGQENHRIRRSSSVMFKLLENCRSLVRLLMQDHGVSVGGLIKYSDDLILGDLATPMNDKYRPRIGASGRTKSSGRLRDQRLTLGEKAQLKDGRFDDCYGFVDLLREVAPVAFCFAWIAGPNSEVVADLPKPFQRLRT